MYFSFTAFLLALTLGESRLILGFLICGGNHQGSFEIDLNVSYFKHLIWCQHSWISSCRKLAYYLYRYISQSNVNWTWTNCNCQQKKMVAYVSHGWESFILNHTMKATASTLLKCWGFKPLSPGVTFCAVLALNEFYNQILHSCKERNCSSQTP